MKKNGEHNTRERKTSEREERLVHRTSFSDDEFIICDQFIQHVNESPIMGDTKSGINIPPFKL